MKVFIASGDQLTKISAFFCFRKVEFRSVGPGLIFCQQTWQIGATTSILHSSPAAYISVKISAKGRGPQDKIWNFMGNTQKIFWHILTFLTNLKLEEKNYFDHLASGVWTVVLPSHLWCQNVTSICWSFWRDSGELCQSLSSYKLTNIFFSQTCLKILYQGN